MENILTHTPITGGTLVSRFLNRCQGRRRPSAPSPEPVAAAPLTAVEAASPAMDSERVAYLLPWLSPLEDRLIGYGRPIPEISAR